MRIQLLPHTSYTYGELADFFNIQLNSFTSHKTEKLLELEQYCSFSEVNSTIYIEQVYCPYYLGSLTNRRAFRRMLYNCIPANKIVNELLLAKQMKKQYKKDLETYSLKELIGYIKYYLFLDYGCGTSEEGLKGKSQAIFCKLEQDILIPLTQEEMSRKQKLIQQWYGNLTENVLLITDKLNAGEASSAEAWDLLTSLCCLDTYKDFKKTLNGGVAASLYNSYLLIDYSNIDNDIDDEDIDDDEFSRTIIERH